MAGHPVQTPIRTPAERRIRRSWWFLAGSFFILGLVTTLRLVAGVPQRIDWILAGLVLVSGLAAVIHREAVGALEAGRRREAESFARILQGLSRSVSPDAIVGAIVEELGVGTGADHIIVVRLRPDAAALEATLVSRRAGVPSSTTILPIFELEDPGADVGRSPGLRRAPVAIPVGEKPAAAPATPSATAVTLADTPVGAGLAVGASAATAQTAVRDAPSVAARDLGPSVAARDVGPSVAAREREQIEGAPAFGGNAPGTRAEPTTALPVDRRASDRATRRERRRGWTALGAVASLRAFASGSGWDEAEVPLGHASGPALRIAERVAARVRSDYGLKHTIAAPLVTGSSVVGAIVLSRRTDDAWPVAAQRILAGAAIEASAALDRAYSHRSAEARASTDALTGLPNRRYFDEFCGLLARRRRADDALGVLMIDIDRFKRLNDTFGHAVGDQVLKAVAGALASAVREDDVPARYGGEEFAVLIRNPDGGRAMQIGERVRQAVESLDLAPIGVPTVHVSVGVAISLTADEPIDAVIARADGALYAAKGAGRNRVIAA